MFLPNMGCMNSNTQINTSEVVYVDGYTGTVGCPRPMTDAEFNKAVSMVRKEAFGEDKMIIAKQVTQNKCLVTEQVKQIANAFEFEDNKLAYAKFAYDYTYDQDNYYLMNEIFTFSDSKEELNRYISGR